MEEDRSAESIPLLQAEVRQLHQAIASHMVVDQAIGVVIVLGRLAPEQGWDVLKEVSQHTNTKLRAVAEQVVESMHGKELPASTRGALDTALARTRP
ncbi:ANTAR domain-containing protein [Streptomyces sp. NPDC050264]|uniref:ANTAR domain-containing protein n=1 Tax=Streptomyces sp. NPDC050264 TaxID=3155038 RepID=UPI00343F92AB